VFVPGYYLASILGKKVKVDVIPYSFIFGLAFQAINVAFYSVFSVAIWMDFNSVLLLTTAISVIALKIITYKIGARFDFEHLKIEISHSLRNPVFYIFMFAFVFRFFYSSYNTMSLLPDASLYLDSARTIVSKGMFSSNVLHDESLGTLAALGLSEHRFVIFIFALFFQISNVSMRSALLAIIFIGSLLVFPIYDVTKEFFGKNAGVLAAIMVSFHPLFIYFSSILFGPEISGLLFLLVSFYLIIEGGRNKSALALLAAGILIGVSEELWYPQFYIVVPFVPLLFGLFYGNSNRVRDKRFIMNLLICGFFVFLYVFALKVYSLYFIYVPIVLAETIVFCLSSRFEQKSSYFALSIVAGLIIPTVLSVFPHYVLPSQVSSTIKTATEAGLIPSIINAFTLFLKGSSLTGLIDCAKYLSNYATAITLVLFLLAFLNTKNMKGNLVLGSLVLFDFILVSLTPPPLYPQYLSSQGRYYLLPTALMIILGSCFLSRSIEVTIEGVSSTAIRLRKKVTTIRLPLVTTLILLSLIFSLFFIPQYQAYLQDIHQENPIDKYGWSVNFLDWIMANTSEKDILLTSRARELAWFTDRKTASLFSPSAKPEDMDYAELSNLYEQFNASYLVIESYFYWSFPKLQNLYQPSSTSLGTVILPSDALMSHLTNSSFEAGAYQLIFYENSEKGICSVWKLVSYSGLSINSIYQDLSSKTLSAGNGGSLAFENNTSKLVIGDGKNYTYTYQEAPLNITLDEKAVKFFAWDVGEISRANIDRIELWNAGNHVADVLPHSETGNWTTLFDVNNIDNIRIIISGKSGGYITVNWLVIGTYQATG
jgi:hypothetical protein